MPDKTHAEKENARRKDKKPAPTETTAADKPREGKWKAREDGKTGTEFPSGFGAGTLY